MTAAAPSPKRRLWGPNEYVPYTPTAWHRDHRVAIGGILGFSAISLTLAILGPSAVTLVLGPRDGSLLPPWYGPALPQRPNEWVVCIAAWVAILLGGASLLIALRALDAGWRPRPRRLCTMGTVLALLHAVVPPLTSADVLMYAAYGRLQLIGRNPYEITPAEVFRSQYDPVMEWTERPWEDTPSVYGPIVSWLQLAANHLGGENMHDIVFWLQLFHVLAFLGACAATIWIARGDRDRLNRAILMTVANPLMIWGIVISAHNEALSVIFAVGGMMLMRRSALGAGLGIGLAGCAKLSIGLWGLAMLWAYRKQPKKAALLCLGAAIPMSLAYGLWQPQALVSVLRNGSYVSGGSWAQPVSRFFDHVMLLDTTTAKLLTGIISYSLLVVLVIVLWRLLPWSAVPGIAPDTSPRDDVMTVAVRAALVLSVAWLVSAMYTLSWYDLIAFVPLGVLASSRLDVIMIVRNTFLSVAYVPGRVVDLSDQLDTVVTQVRETVSPVVQLGVVVAIFAWAVERRRSRRRGDPAAEGAGSNVMTSDGAPSDGADGADRGATDEDPSPDRGDRSGATGTVDRTTLAT
ncbi:polyprenol phosphomannose-dependent alpha 1,6 mannosyltransferase MptB [Propionibacteriaceae bacterium Y2011]|uniref:polyprenol phosphomannose-dependent alpha 1,6 mannosyltransferase MptB n=1 Tax=Microlunatus sp. Y2014 TaxID=3418488 RepID=UPI003B4CD029